MNNKKKMIVILLSVDNEITPKSRGIYLSDHLPSLAGKTDQLLQVF